MDLPVNQFKRRLAAGEEQLGFWTSLASPMVSEILGHSGIDWILIDCEHTPNELQDVFHHLRALKGCPASAIVRPSWNDMVEIKRLLDAGAQSLIVPYVNSAEQARAAVAATRYPPAGVRGVAGASRASNYGRIAGYLGAASDEIAVVVQIETRTAVEALDEIMAVAGIDGIFVGPSDLSASCGHIGNPDHPEVQAMIEAVPERARQAGVAAGILARSLDDARRCRALGYSFISVGSDQGLLMDGAAERIAALKA
ncbi:MAG: hypothetical protein D6754_10985 [Alphaproteobacteria bacterium]|nr:MAG: hypothetical protein D6754_10985 [Alphaproteobacteria bacterium]